MPTFTIQSPDGRKIKIRANDEATAIRGAQEWAAANPKSGAQPQEAMTDALAQGSAASQRLGQPTQPSLYDRAQSFARGAIEGVPIVGPALSGAQREAEVQLAGLISGRGADAFRDKAAAREEFLKRTAGNERVAGQVTGAVGTMVPIGATALGGRLLGTAGSLGRQMLVGGASSAGITGADTLARGGSIADAGTNAAIGGALGVAAPVVLGAGGKVLNAVTGRGAAAKTGIPEIDDLYAAKDKAYAVVDNLGARYSAQSVDDLYSGMIQRAAKDNINPDLHGKAYAQIVDLERRRGPKTLTELDQLRQEIRRDVASVRDGGDAHFGKLMIGAIDDFIEKAGPAQMAGGDARAAQQAITAARRMNTILRKSEALQDALEAARLRVAATGSGGNIDNAVRQELTKLLKSPKHHWTDAEKKMIGNAILGKGPMQNVLRLIGKLSPSGSGLMAALGLGSTVANPAMAVAPAAGLVAKTLSDRMTRRGVDALTGAVRTGGASLPAPATQRALLPPAAVPLSLPLSSGEQRRPLPITVNGANRLPGYP